MQETPDVITPTPELTLDEYRAQREGRTPPAKPAEPPAAPETEAEKPTPGEPKPAEESDPSDQKQEPEDGEKAKHKGGFQKRIDKLTREREELRARVAELEGKPAEGKPAGKPAEATATEKPRVENYETYDAYVEALTEWKVEQKEQARAKAEAESKAKTEQQAKVATFQERADVARKAHEDFDEVLEDAPPITTAMREAMLDSEVGPELAYWLAKNSTPRSAAMSRGS